MDSNCPPGFGKVGGKEMNQKIILSSFSGGVNTTATTRWKHRQETSMEFFAHTATLPDGKPDPDQDHWQPLSEHLRNVARLTKEFATPLGPVAEAELTGLLQDS